MRRAPSCLLFAGFIVSLGCVAPDPASAESRVRHSTPIRLPLQRVTSPHDRHLTGLGHGRAVRHRTADRRFHSGRHHRALLHTHDGFYPTGPLTLPYVDTVGEAPIMADEGQIPPPPSRAIGIPSTADLPASTGIGPGPAASPTIYVLNGSKRSLRRGTGARIVTMDQADPQIGMGNGRPRIIHLDVPRSR
jgi:hypothetical protein